MSALLAWPGKARGLAGVWLHRVLRFEEPAKPESALGAGLTEPMIPAGAAEGTPSDRLLAWLLAGLEASRREDLGGEMWRSRSEGLFRAAIAAWSEDEPERSASGFCDWIGRMDHLAAWLDDRDGRPESEAARYVRAYLTMSPGYQFGQPASASSSVMHGYLTMQFFGGGGAVARYIEKCCDEPDAVRALARAGFEPLERPSEDRAWEGLSLLEKEEIQRSIEPRASVEKRGAGWI